MTRVRTIYVFTASIRTFFERGPTLLVLFSFIGIVSSLAWHAGTAYGLRAQIGVIILTGLAWLAASIIALNMLIDSGTKLELSSMYLTDYKGIVWTTTTFTLGLIVFACIVLVCASLFLLPFLPAGSTALLQLLQDPYSLTVGQGYTILVQLQSVLLTLYVATRLMLFPSYVAVESKSFWTAMARSLNTTREHITRLVPIMLVAATSIPLSAVIGIRVEPLILTQIAAYQSLPYINQVVAGGVYALLVAAGTVFTLSLLATAYSQVK